MGTYHDASLPLVYLIFGFASSLLRLTCFRHTWRILLHTIVTSVDKYASWRGKMIKGNLLYFYLHVIVIDGLRTACDIVMGQGNVRWRCPTFAGEKALILGSTGCIP